MGTSSSRGDATKARILDEALTLFATKGFRATTVRDIAAAVGLRQGALYNHFANKEAILEALVGDLMSSAVVTIFEEKEPADLYRRGKGLLMSIATTFKLLSFDGKNEALFRLMMQELYKNSAIRDLYHEYFYQQNIKKLSSIFFMMMQEEMIRSGDPLLLANEFLAPLFFYQMQVSLLKLDAKSTSAAVTMFEKHVDAFWDTVRIPEEKSDTLF